MNSESNTPLAVDAESSAEISYLLAALEADPENWNTRRYLAEYYLHNGDEKRAIALVSTAPVPPSKEDDCVFSAQLVSRLSVIRGHQFLDTFLVDHASSAKAHYFKGQLFEQQDLADRARIHYKVARVLDPSVGEQGDLELCPVDQESAQRLALAYEQTSLIAVSAAPTPEVAQVRPLAPPPEAVALPMPSSPAAEQSASVALAGGTGDAEGVVIAAVTEAPELSPSEAATGSLEEAPARNPEDGLAAAALAPALAEAPPPSVDEVIQGMTSLIDLTPSDAASNPDAVINQIQHEATATTTTGDILADIVERQTAVVAALSDTGEPIEKPHIAEHKMKGDKIAALAIAVLVHAAIIGLFTMVILSIPQNDPPEIYASVANYDADTNLQTSEIKKPTMRKSAPQAQQTPIMTSAAFSDVAMPTVDVSVDSALLGFGADMGMDFGMSFEAPGGDSGMSSIPPSMAGRCSMGQRMARLKESGATTACESAVRKALRFLRENQNEDGSFGKENQASMTGLAILAYLGHCETPDSMEFGNSVTDATLYLMKLAKNGKGDYFITPGVPGQNWPYEHAIVTYALAEMYTMTKASGAAKRIPQLESVMKKGIRTIISRQHRAGGWDYAYAMSENGDTSVAGWNFQALKAGYNTGERITGLERALDRAIEYFKSAQTKNGGFAYRPKEKLVDKHGLGGVGALALELWKEGDSEEVEHAFEWLDVHHLKQARPEAYAWYYTMQAYFIDGGDKWMKWNGMAMDKILALQKDDGRFDINPGHGPKEPATKAVYSTALATLMLEVYYRYLPTSQKLQDKG